MGKDPNLSLSQLKKRPDLVLWWLYARQTAKRRALPDFIIAGTAKGGTTSLFQYLSDHPRIFPPLRKEIKYFDCNYFMGPSWYKAHFPLNRKLKKYNGITGEASPNYLGHPTAMQRIAMALPEVKIIIILRNPVDRAFSHYHLSAKVGEEDLTFEEAINFETTRLAGEAEKIAADYYYPQATYIKHSYLERGKYIEQIPVVLKLFKKEKLLFLRSEDFYDDPGKIYRQVLDFLNLPLWEPKQYKVFKQGTYKEQMTESLRNQLVEFFRPYNQRLYQELGRDFDWDK